MAIIAILDLSMVESACALDWARITELNAMDRCMSVGHRDA